MSKIANTRAASTTIAFRLRPVAAGAALLVAFAAQAHAEQAVTAPQASA